MEMDLHERLKAAKIVNAGGGGEPPVFVEKTVTENGTYIALDDEGSSEESSSDETVSSSCELTDCCPSQDVTKSSMGPDTTLSEKTLLQIVQDLKM